MWAEAVADGEAARPGERTRPGHGQDVGEAGTPDHDQRPVERSDALDLRGAGERLSPILMTALATALAVAPLVFFGNRPGQEIEFPMAVVILGGLATSTLLNLFVLPSLYLRFGRPRTAGAAAAAAAPMPGHPAPARCPRSLDRPTILTRAGSTLTAAACWRRWPL